MNKKIEVMLIVLLVSLSVIVIKGEITGDATEDNIFGFKEGVLKALEKIPEPPTCGEINPETGKTIECRPTGGPGGEPYEPPYFDAQKYIFGTSTFEGGFSTAQGDIKKGSKTKGILECRGGICEVKWLDYYSLPGCELNFLTFDIEFSKIDDSVKAYPKSCEFLKDLPGGLTSDKRFGRTPQFCNNYTIECTNIESATSNLKGGTTAASASKLDVVFIIDYCTKAPDVNNPRAIRKLCSIDETQQPDIFRLEITKRSGGRLGESIPTSSLVTSIIGGSTTILANAVQGVANRAIQNNNLRIASFFGAIAQTLNTANQFLGDIYS